MQNLPSAATYKTSRAAIILILGMLMTVSPFAIDMYLPAFSQIATDFKTTPARISLSVTSYFIGFASGQLLYGPLLDKFGRKKPLYVGLSLFIITCVACMISKSVEMLVAVRFLQAISGCVAGVAAITMVRDFFPVEESAKVFSLLMLVLGLSPLLAPTIGGFIASGLGWHWVFVALIFLALLVLLIVIFFLPTAYAPDPTVSLRAGPMLNTFKRILTTRQFYTYALASSFSFATLFLYVAGSPVIFMEVFGVSPKVYGGIFALLSVGFIGGNQLNILLLKKYKSEQIFVTALSLQVIMAIIFLIGAWQNWYGLVATTTMFFCLLTCIGFIYPNGSAIALTPFTTNVGSASALLGFSQIGIAGITSVCIGLFNTNQIWPIAAMIVATASVALGILLLSKLGAATKSGKESVER